MKNIFHITAKKVALLCLCVGAVFLASTDFHGTAWGADEQESVTVPGSIYDYLNRKFIKPLQKPDAKISLCYLLEKNRWIAFHPPAITDRIKIITNANVSDHISHEPETVINYSLEFQIRDKNNNILKSGIYHKYSKITRYKNIKGGEEYTSSYYFSEPLIPADGRIVILDFSGIPVKKNLKIRLRLVEHDPAISDVVLRLYYPERTPESQLKHLWQRMGKAKREYLSRSNIYSQEFITRNEQFNLMRRFWRPLAPQGVEGRDYMFRKLYVNIEPEGIPIDQPVVHKGILLDKRFRLTFPIDEQGMSLKFVFFRTGALGDRKAAERKEGLDKKTVGFLPLISLKWFGKKRKTEVWEIPWNGDQTVYQNTLQGGIIELSCDQNIGVLMYNVENDREMDITPAPLKIQTFMLDENQYAVYKISHMEGESTPLRVSFRKQMHEWNQSFEKVFYEFYDASGNMIRQAHLNVSLTPSFYDRYVEGPSRTILSDPVYQYFRIPPEVDKIRFSASGPLLVNVHNRPPQRYKKTNIPEDYYQSTDADELKQLTWFPLSPVVENTLPEQRNSIFVAVQHRPPEIESYLDKGYFKWETFEWKNHDRNGHYILTPSEAKEYQRDASLTSNFKELPLNKTVTVDFRSAGQLKKMRPGFVYYCGGRRQQGKEYKSANPGPFTIELKIDGRPYFKSAFMGKTGMVTLPPVLKGKHQLEILSLAPVKPFINMIRSEKPGYYLRFAHRLSTTPLELDYTKLSRDDETLTLAVFFPEMHPQRLQFSVQIKNKTTGSSPAAAGPFCGFTIFKRRYSLRSDDRGAAYLLNSSSPILGAWQHCFLPIRGDLKPGQYTIEISLEKGAGGYIFPYRLIPGIYPERKMFKEAKS